MHRLIFIFINILFLSSCNHLIKDAQMPNISHFETSSSASYKKALQPYKSSYGEIVLYDHPEVDKWIRYFTGRGRSVMRVYLERSSRYLPIMKTVIRDSGLPDELVYVALIESGFSPKAHSHANAVGYWQFIYGTGKRYGLRIDGYVDERRDPVLSTHAAVNYFKDLYSLFGSWPLALSAYNAGEYRINRAVLRHYNRDYWYLISKKALPRETRNYVPKLIAAIKIANNPKKYGFHNIEFQPHLNYEVVNVKKPISLKKLAKNINTPYKELQRLNPMYKGEYVPVYNKKDTYIRVPVKHFVNESVLLSSLMTNPPQAYHYHYYYKVRKGDSLYRIARKHGTTINKLRRANNLGRKSLIRVNQRLKIPTRTLVASSSSASRSVASVSNNNSYYTVRKGDSVTRIARKHGISLQRLRKLNNLSAKAIIHPGQKLKIRNIQKKTVEAEKDSNFSGKHYTVRSGDTLIGIAKQYKVDLSQLMQLNSLNFKSVLLAGMKLKIPQ